MSLDDDDILDPEVTHGEYQGDGILPNATATLVLGIISIVGCFLYGIPGLICGIIALTMHPKDKQLYMSNKAKYANSYKNANAGYICAIIGVSLSALYFLMFILIIVMGVAAGEFR